MRHIPLNEYYKDISDKDQDFSIEFDESKQDDMINTPGCRIPVALVNYKVGKEWKKASCGERAIFLTRINETKLRVSVREKNMKKYLKQSLNYNCCYKFFQRSLRPGLQYRKLRFTDCKELQNGKIIFIKSDFINIQCFQKVHNKSKLIYEDNFAFCRKNNATSKHSDKTLKKKKYNILIVGMDSMSLSRFVQTMTRTVTFLKNNFWPGFRGYHKTGENTFPNLMAALMGQNLTTIEHKCSGKMDQCNDILIWSMFKKSGYATAYGEDFLQLPDMFSKGYTFRRAPTDHYMRTLFLKGEREINHRSLLCNGQVSSGQQLLNYALDFVLTYRNDTFFGFFWMNSFSHNINNRPQDADKLFEDFFNRLSYTGALENTFVIFLSDHGVRFGEYRLKVESYYDDRMPFLFIWVPPLFKIRYPEKFNSLLINQYRLITPFDLFNTMLEIHEISNNSTRKIESSAKHQSLFGIVSANRTCQDVGIHDKWCSCHKLYPIDVDDTEVVKSVHFVVSYIKNIIKNIKTKRCWSCTNLALNNVSRIHFYYDNEKVNLYYVVAFSMRPKNIFYEATVLRKNKKMELVGPVNIISPYKGFGYCTINHEDKIFCVCQKIANCRLKTTL
ncbi:unnamed protein product, partial [Brenthis ino]